MLKRRSCVLLVPVAFLLAVQAVSLPARVLGEEAPVHDVYFSPKGGASEAVMKALGNAKESVLVQAYSFTSAPIAKALLEAHKRGVRVQVLLDKSNRTARYSSADFLANSGIPVSIDGAHAIAHDKVMVIDRATILTGSMNFTKAGEERNAENLLVIRDVALAVKYAANWREHAEHSEPYAGRMAEAREPTKKKRSKKLNEEAASHDQ